MESNLIEVTYKDEFEFKKRKLNFFNSDCILIDKTKNVKINDRVFVILHFPYLNKTVTRIGDVIWTVPKQNFSQFKSGFGVRFINALDLEK